MVIYLHKIPKEFYEKNISKPSNYEQTADLPLIRFLKNSMAALSHRLHGLQQSKDIKMKGFLFSSNIITT